MVTYAHNPLDITPQMTSNTTPSPCVADASEIGGYAPWYAFDHVASIGCTPGSSFPAWVRFDLGAGNESAITSYTVSAIATYHAPKNWTLEGSNDLGGAWTVLHTVTNQTDWTPSEMRTYTPSLSGSYRYYQINVSIDNGGGSLELAQLELINDSTSRNISAHIVLPLLSAYGSLSNPVRHMQDVIQLPSLKVSGSLTNPDRHVNGQLSLPLAQMSAALSVFTFISSSSTLDASIGAITASGYGGGIAKGSIGPITLSGSVIQNPIARLSASIGPVAMSGDILQQQIGTLNAWIGGITSTTSGINNEIGILNSSISAISLSANCIPGYAGSLSESIGSVKLSAHSYWTGTNSATISIPAVHIDAQIREALDNMIALCLNTKNLGLTQYTAYDYNSFCVFNGKTIAAKRTGIYELSGTDDDGTPIPWRLKTGKINLNDNKLRTLRISGKITSDIKVIVGKPDGTLYEYEADPVSENEDVVRVKVGKGICGGMGFHDKYAYLTIEFQNKTDALITVDKIAGYGIK